MKKLLLIILLFPSLSFAQKKGADFCDKFKVKHDDMSGVSEIEYSQSKNPVHVIKAKINNSIHYKLFFSVSTYSSQSYFEKGVTLKLSDGKLMNYPNEQVEYSYVGSGKYLITSWVTLTEEEVGFLAINPIVKFRQYLQDTELSLKQIEFQKESLICARRVNL